MGYFKYLISENFSKADYIGLFLVIFGIRMSNSWFNLELTMINLLQDRLLLLLLFLLILIVISCQFFKHIRKKCTNLIFRIIFGLMILNNVCLLFNYFSLEKTNHVKLYKIESYENDRLIIMELENDSCQFIVDIKLTNELVNCNEIIKNEKISIVTKKGLLGMKVIQEMNCL